ncbi:MAG: ABC transporter permease [Verrucomicrobiota bacterium]
MSYAWRIAVREFTENVKTKGFWIGLLILPALILLGATVPTLVARQATPTRHFVLVDPAGTFAAPVAREFETERREQVQGAFRDWFQRWRRPDAPLPVPTHRPFDLSAALAEARSRLRPDAPEFIPPRPRFVLAPLPAGISPTDDLPRLEQELRPWLRGERPLPGTPGAPPAPLFAAVLIPAGFAAGSTQAVRYWCENQADTDLRERIERVLGRELRHREYARLGLDPADVARIEGLAAPVEALNPRKSGGDERVGLSDALRQWAPSFFVYLLWIAIFAISQMLLNSVIEEKSNKIIEVLLSSVTPGELMLGKLMGVAAVGLVMVSVWLASMVAAMLWAAPAAGVDPQGLPGAGRLPLDALHILRTTWLLPGFAGYFLLGYTLYAALFLTVGSLCHTLKDAQNFMGPLMMVLMVPLFLLPFIPRDPNGPLAATLSWVPLYTPFLMMNRLAANPPWRDVVGTAVLLVGFNALVLWGCGRIFRLAILRTGQPPRLVELWRWLRRS